MAGRKATAASKVSAKSTTVKFDYEKDTPGTVRFKERVDDDSPVVVGTLYMKKPAAEALENPESLTVTIRAGG